MVYALYQGQVYEVAELIRNLSGEVTHVRLDTQAGITVPIPVGEITFVPYPGLGNGIGGGSGSGGSGGGSNQPIRSETPPGAPVNGQVWQNVGSVTTAGVPAGHYAVWNGAAWVPVGTGQPSGSVTSSTTAPTSPAVGQVWLNTSGGTVSGIPSGRFAVWNGTAWVDAGLYQPSTSTASSAATVTLTGDVTGSGTGSVGTTLASTGVVAGTYGSATELVAMTVDAKGRVTAISEIALPPAAGGGVTEIDVNGVGNLVGNVNLSGAGLNLTGQTVSFDGYATDAELTAAIAAHNAASDPHAQYLQQTEAYGSNFLAQTTAPTSPTAGDVWRNTAGITVSGVPAGNFAVWSGTAWVNRGSQYPFLSVGQPADIQPGPNGTYLSTTAGVVGWTALAEKDSNPGFVAERTADTPFVVAQAQAANSIVIPYNPGAQLVDVVNGYDPVTGVFTVPAGLGGVWIFGIGLTSAFLAALQPVESPYIWGYVSRNNALPDGRVVAGNYFVANGSLAIPCAPGDVIRFWINTFPASPSSPGTAPSNANVTGTVYGYLAYPTS